MVYVDALRGVAILLVVYVHLVSQGLFFNKGGWEGSLASPAVICQPFRMALFFFISGLLAYTAYDSQTLRKRVSNRLTRQLWPTLVVAALFNAVFFWKGWESLIFNRHNAGYWFTQSLVQTFIFYALLAWGMRKLQFSKGAETGVLLIVIATLVWLRRYLFGDGHIGAFYMATYLVKTIQWAPFFLAGVVARMWLPRFNKFIERGWPIILAGVVYFGAGLVWKEIRVPELMSLTGVMGIFALFHLTGSFWGGGNIISKGLAFLGKKTLPIYLYHYFMIQPLCTHRLLRWARGIYGEPWLEIPCVMLGALAIALLCLGIDEGIKRLVPALHDFLYRPLNLLRAPFRNGDGSRLRWAMLSRVRR